MNVSRKAAEIDAGDQAATAGMTLAEMNRFDAHLAAYLAGHVSPEVLDRGRSEARTYVEWLRRVS